MRSSLLPASRSEGRSYLKVKPPNCVSGRTQRSPWMSKKESTLPLASLLRIWQRHLKETAIILAACLPWQSTLGALLGWMQQQPVNSSSRTYQAKGSPGGEWQSLIPLGWCRDQLRVIRQSCVIHYYRRHHHLHEEWRAWKAVFLYKLESILLYTRTWILRGTHPPASRIPWPCREGWLLCQAKGPTLQQDMVIFLLLPPIYRFPYCLLWINRAKTPGILLLGEKEPVSNGNILIKAH